MLVLSTDKIKSRIYTIRDMQVMLDTDLAELYNAKTKILNQAVNRNSERFPENFMFQISQGEFDNLRSQFVTSNWGGRRNLMLNFSSLNALEVGI